MTSYTVTLDNQYVLFDSLVLNEGNTAAHNLTLTRTVNGHGKLTFTLPRANAWYDAVTAPSSVVTVSTPGTTQPLFTGRLLKHSVDVYGRRTLTYAGVSSTLTKRQQRPFTYQGTAQGFLTTLISKHNQGLTVKDPQWSVGTVTGLPTTQVSITVDKPMSTWDALTTHVVNLFGAYLLPAIGPTGAPVLHVSTTSGPTSNQVVSLTSNVIDLDAALDVSTMITRFYPVGKTLTHDDGSTELVTITSVNNGKDYLQDDTLLALHGLNEGTETFDIDDPGKLLTTSARQFQKLKLAKFTATLTVADLSAMNTSIDAYMDGDMVPIDIPEYGITDTVQLTSVTLKLDNPGNSTITLGAERATLTSATSKAADLVVESIRNTTKLNDTVSTVQTTVTGATQAAKDATAKAESAQSKADKAATDADSAKSAAATAKSTADQAVKDAATAQAVADAATASAVNVVADPGFENPTLWDARVKASTLKQTSFATGGAHGGTTCFQFTLNGVTTMNTLKIVPGAIPVQPGQVWRVKAWAKTTADFVREPNNTKIRVGKQDGTLFASYPFPTSTSWAALGDDQVVIPAGMTSMTITVTTSANSTGSLWVDDLEIVNVTDVVAAQKAAADAKTAADQAKSTADNAQIAADKARGAADKAQTAADQAQESALSATDTYARDASQGLGGLVFDGSSAGVQAATVVVDSPDGLKGKVIRKPASQKGSLWIHDTRGRVPLKTNVVYEVHATIRVPAQTPAATGSLYVGVDGLRNTDGTWAYVNTTGVESYATQHYVALSASTTRPENFTTYRGYFVASPAAKTSGHGGARPDPSKPATIHPDATHVQPIVLMSYNNVPDLVEISDWGITAVPASTVDAASKAQRDADAALLSASTAATDAATAAGIAGGKADVLIQSTTPATDMRKPTTLWIDTTGNANTPKRWNGSAWATVTDKAATDAAAKAVEAKTAADQAQSSADAAWIGAQSSNLIKDGTFRTTKASDHLASTSTAGDGVADSTGLKFNATGFTGVVPHPASSYGLTSAGANVYARGTNGGNEGFPTTPGRTYRFSIHAAHAATTPNPKDNFQMRVATRKNGVWTVASIGEKLAPASTTPDTEFTHLTTVWKVPNGVDAIRPGFGTPNTVPTETSQWWVTNWATIDVTEAQQALDDIANVQNTIEIHDSLISQLPGQILSTVSSTYVTSTGITEKMESFTSKVTQDAEKITNDFSVVTEKVSVVDGKIVAETTSREQRIQYDLDGITIGTPGSKVKAVYDDHGVHIKVDNVERATFTDTGSVTPDMTITGALQIGNRIIEKSPGGGMWIRRA